MQSINLGLDLLLPHQTCKEVILNENLIKLDQFASNSVVDFIDFESLDTISDVNTRVIINNGSYKDQIACFIGGSSGWKYFKPQKGMVLYFIKQYRWYVYYDGWQPVNRVDTEDLGASSMAGAGASSASAAAFTSIDDVCNLELSKPLTHLFLAANVTINITSIINAPTTLIIKQNDTSLYNVTWGDNLRWKNATIHQITQTTNSMDIIRLYPLVETPHILAEIIGQDFQY